MFGIGIGCAWKRMVDQGYEVQQLLKTFSEIHSCMSLIRQIAGLQFNLPAEVGDLAFQLCNMGGELVSIEGLIDSLGQPVDPGLLDEPRWHTAEAWISLQRRITMG